MTTADQDFAALGEELKQLRADFTKLAGTIAELLQHRGEETAARVRSAAQETLSDTKKRLDNVVEAIDEKPLTASLTAFGIGVFVGMLFFGRR